MKWTQIDIYCFGCHVNHHKFKIFIDGIINKANNWFKSVQGGIDLSLLNFYKKVIYKQKYYILDLLFLQRL